ncbi:MAG: SRPBCC domain-containing protein [Alphaproteobacteria bacterium]|nr:SRPBCC domain-containing protein [Alphaproteobacteria bacterium]
MTAQPLPPALQLSRRLPASRERVFRAWTVPAEVMAWWGPGGFTAPSAEIDLRVGGRYRFAMQPAEGKVFYITGTYLEIAPPERLAFTWQWEGTGNDGPESAVTIEFHARGGETDLVLIHEKLWSQEAADNHRWGWNSSFEKLSALYSRT